MDLPFIPRNFNFGLWFGFFRKNNLPKLLEKLIEIQTNNSLLLGKEGGC